MTQESFQMPLIYPIVEPEEVVIPNGGVFRHQAIERPLKAINISYKIHQSWHKFFFSGGFKISEKLRAIFVEAYRNNLMIRPSPEDILNVFEMPVSSIRVIIVGQDPYPGWDSEMKTPVANGRAFATNSKTIPGSLSRIMDSIQEKLGSVEITNPDQPFSLQGWINQGVFLLNNTPIVFVLRDKNITLDAEMKATLAFPKLCWKGLTKEICEFVVSLNSQIRVILVGSETHYLDGKLPGCIKTSHPSTRSSKDFTGECFCQVPEINWRRV